MDTIHLTLRAIGAPDMAFFESWRESLDPTDPMGFVRTIPHCLEETTPYSHTSLVNAGISAIENGIGALLCEGCTTAADCEGDAACLAFPGGNSFCATACEPEACPQGYSCYDTSGGAGTNHHCAPTAGDICQSCVPFACPAVADPPLFFDGFEFGDTSAWSVTVPS
ncbi:MAG: hypothetical protein K8R59_02380 [Thermoanaerobaculales bacterium]|nr:hypothetical protein [Thermoanaerobaculales bacterium]